MKKTYFIHIWSGIFLSGVLLLLILPGCKTTMAPIPLVGGDEDIAQLEGVWAGEYTSRETGRHGSIYFVLTADADSASGDVFMIPRDWEEDYGFDDGYDFRSHPMAQPITITFVQVNDDRIRGVLDLYKDPECGCTLLTTFEGRMKQDAIEGEFVSRSLEHDHVHKGVWRATREKKKATS